MATLIIASLFGGTGEFAVALFGFNAEREVRGGEGLEEFNRIFHPSFSSFPRPPTALLSGGIVEAINTTDWQLFQETDRLFRTFLENVESRWKGFGRWNEIIRDILFTTRINIAKTCRHTACLGESVSYQHASNANEGWNGGRDLIRKWNSRQFHSACRTSNNVVPLGEEEASVAVGDDS